MVVISCELLSLQDFFLGGEFMNIAIVDDMQSDIDEISNLLYQFFLDSDISVKPQVSLYTSAEMFWNNYEVGKYDLIMLDIVIAQDNGIDIAKKIRAYRDEAKIIFITTSMEFALNGYEVFASGYIIKPVTKQQELFYQCMRHCLMNNIDDKKLLVDSCGQEISIEYKKILYVSVGSKRYCQVCTESEILDTSNNYAQCSEQLISDTRFLECYHRVIINMDKVVEMCSEEFIMSNGERIPISRRKKNQVARDYMNYLINK